ncbi:late competence protein ComER [Paenibacillus turpanensis]|uniref:late competence protein ComER n=1 Tax=Paenibacillus turpanensis TaxID=2689078 RepID=UPI00140CC087|nr:late competence protein ComER [Paenibacillus turpanensis]
MNVGFIGTGSMGSILIEAMLRSGALQPQQVVAANRTREKAQQLAARYPGMKVASSNAEVFQECDMVFLCIKPMEYKKVIDEVKPYALPTHSIVSITSPVLLKHLEDHLPSKITKMIPSITNYTCSGATLCIYGTRIMPEDAEQLEGLLRQFSTPLRISEQYTRICSDLSSCGPAFLAFFVQSLINGAIAHTGIPEEQATELASQMTLGTGMLLTEGNFSPETLQQRVSVPGGITAEGLKLLSNEIGDVFCQLFKVTHDKYDEDVQKIEAQFYGTTEPTKL